MVNNINIENCLGHTTDECVPETLENTSIEIIKTDSTSIMDTSPRVHNMAKHVLSNFNDNGDASPRVHNLAIPGLSNFDDSIKTRSPISPKSNHLNSIPQINEEDPNVVLRILKANNAERPIIAHLNINFLNPKFEALKSLIKDKIDILLISETKLDNTFPRGQFIIEGYKKPIRLDRNCHGGGILFFIRDDLPCKELTSHTFPNDVEGIFIDITIRKMKWLIMGGYNPAKEKISYFLKHIGNELDKYLSSYENLMVFGDFNSEMSENEMIDFCETYNLQNLIKDPTCYKSISNPSSIDVMLTNKKSSFVNSMTLETGLSDHHKMTVTVLKRYFKKRDPIVIDYRDFKAFDGLKVRDEIRQRLEKCEFLDVDIFKNVFDEILDIHAPKKKKVVRGNNAPFMNKTLSKAFMQRSRLKNKLNKDPTEMNKSKYKKHRNFCLNLLKREKRKYYDNLDIKVFKDNKKFWKKIKPLFSEKKYFEK